MDATILFRLNDEQAKKAINGLEGSLKNLSKIAETAVNPRFDKDGNLLGYVEKLTDEYGKVLTVNHQIVDILNEENEVVSREDKIVGSSLVINYEKMAKLSERRAKNEEKAARKRAESEAKAASDAEKAAQKSQAAHEKEIAARMQNIEAYRKLQQNIDSEASKLLQQEEELNRKSEERAQKEKEIADAMAEQAAHAERQQGLNLTFANWNDWGADSGYQSRLSDSFVYDTIPIQQYIDSLTGVEREQSRINSTTSMFATISDKSYRDYAARNNLAEESVKGFSNASEEAASSENKLAKETENAGKKAEESSKAFGLLHTVFLRLAHTAISSITRAFREALTEMKNVDSELVVVRKVSGATAEELSALKDRAYEVGAAYGVAASDYLNAAAEMTRAGYREQAGDLAELATKLQLVGDVSQDTANQFLIATDKAYHMNGDMKKLGDTIDKLNEIDNNYATSIQKVADGIGLLAPVASQAHVSFEEMAAAVGTITAVTQRSGAESARALRSLFLNVIKDTSTEIEEGETVTIEQINNLTDALKKYAPEVVKAAEATGELINPMEAIGSLSKAFKEGMLTERELTDIVYGIGGKLRSSQLLALIQNWDMYNDMLETTATAAGSADREVQNALDSWQVKLNQLKNTFTQFVANTVSTDLIKGLIDSVNTIVKSVGNLGNALAIVTSFVVALKLPAIIGFVSKISFGIKGLVATFKVFVLGLKNGKSAMDALKLATDATGMSINIAKIAATALAAALSIAIIAINKSRQAEEERRQKSIESAKAATEEAKAINDLKTKYDESKKAFEEGTGSREEYESAQEAIIQKLKDEGVWTEAATEGYNTLTEAIDANTKAAIENRKAEMLGGLRDAFKDLSEPLYGGLIKTGTSAIPMELRKVLGQWKMSGNSNIPSWLNSFSAYDLAFDGSLSINDVFGKDVEGRAARIFELYDSLVKYRRELYESGQGKTSIFQDVNSAINLLEPNVKSAYSLLDDYLSLLSEDEINKLRGDSLWDYLINQWEETNKKTGDSSENLKESTDDVGDSVDNLTKKLNSATDALDKYKKALEGGDKGDAFKSMADAYKNAVELFNKGLTGSNAYMSAIDLLIGSGFADTYEEAGKLLGNKFIKAMFEGGGEDFGANAANYIRTHINEFEGVSVSAVEGGKFSLMVTDMEAFSNSAQVSQEALWSLVGALDAYDSKELDGTEKTLTELTEEPHEIETKTVVDNEELIETEKLIERLDNSVINVKVQTSGGLGGSSNSVHGGFIRYESRASGTDSARGGLSLVNEEGAELIYGNGSAWIAGGGKPVITNIPRGFGVFNAQETKGILERSGIPSFDSGKDITLGGITVTPPDSGGSNSGSGGSSSSSSNIEEILQLLIEYIEKILKKAKSALDEQLKAIDQQIDALRREHDAAEEKNKLEELQLKILEAEKNLAEAKNERTVRYFNKETGQWEWMADQKAVAEAEKALQESKDAYDKEVKEQEYQAQIQALNDLKDSLQDQYNKLADHWSEILNAIKESDEDETDIESILSKLGLDNDTNINIRKLIDSINAFANKLNDGKYDAPLDKKTTEKILGMVGIGWNGKATLSQINGTSSADSNANLKRLYNTNNSSSVIGDTYYINGIKIGSDMMDKPLSQILSVLKIYAN